MIKIQLPILLCGFLFVLSRSQTDIASLNCPTDFNVTVANVTTGIGTSELATFFFAPFRSTNEIAKV